MTVRVRLAGPGDRDAVERLATGMSGRPPDDGFAARYDTIVASHDRAVLVADDGGDLVGYALVQDYGPGLRRAFSVGRLHDLYVDPAARRRGAGRALVEAAVEWCRGRPAPMILDWQARADAVPFYAALGMEGDTAGDTAEYPAYSVDLR